MKRLIVLVLIGVLLTALTACAAGGSEDVGAVTSTANPAGFWLGLWHGCIAPITFLISLFNKSVDVYEANNGGWYNFGFIFGLIVSLGGGRGAGGKAWRKKKGKTSSTRRDDND